MEKVIFIPGNVPSLKNGKIKTKWGIVESKAVKKWKKETQASWMKYRQDFIELAKKANTPILFIHLTFIKKTGAIFDYYGPGETIMDEMVSYNWINDDNAYQIVPVFGKFRIDKESAGVEIRLLSEIPKYNFLK